MAKKGKKKRGKKASASSAPTVRAWADRIEAFLTAPIVREVVAAGLIAAADAISKNPKVRRAADRGADKAGELAAEATHQAEELGASIAAAGGDAARRLFGQAEAARPKGKPKKTARRPPRSDGVPASPH